ncbi:toxin-antitoxin system antitoxin subunit [Megasphaera cerevisiae]|uniref:toxin-antitoxin system antitoxin subunit n=1 Tax=Megasphaera cerevisiae TaxID=39029 RepID=UPI00094261FC|nr:toxin-antitoxin system antitoxin subunit [Megasphaera cerevisiae]OKY53245.1 toxin-antitoxin system antitoxin subunit [Megasphaera cerevisiae]
MDETLRKQAAAIFESMDLTEEEAVALFYKRTVAAGRMPFSASEEQGKAKRKKKRMNERFAEWDAF